MNYLDGPAVCLEDELIEEYGDRFDSLEEIYEYIYKSHEEGNEQRT